MPALIHLDPYTDIVGVGWPQNYTHVALNLQVFDSDIGGTTYDYDDGMGGFYTTSVKSASQVVRIISRYKLRQSGATQTWSTAPTSELAVTGYPDNGNTRKTFNADFDECEHWSPVNGDLGPPSFSGNQAMIGFDSHRTPNTTIQVPNHSDQLFETGTAAKLQFYTYPLTACTAMSPSTTLDTTQVEAVEIDANVLSGLSITFKGAACTIAGLWTPLLGLTPNVSVDVEQVPKELIVLATIGS